MSEGDFQLQDELLRKSLEDFGLDREDQMPTTGSGSREESPEIVVKTNSTSTSPLAIGGSPLLPTMPAEDPAICPYCNKKYRRVCQRDFVWEKQRKTLIPAACA